jgi:D-aminoacyl-tRNA deacylase
VRGLVFSELDPVSSGVWGIVRSELNPRHVGVHGDYSIYSLELGIAFIARGRDVVYLDDVEGLARDHGVDSLLFISRHAMRNPRPMFTVHPTGNWASAELGGEPGKLSPCDPHALSSIFRRLCLLIPEFGLGDFQCSREATHHGPTLSRIPILFLEQGSTPKEWAMRRGWELILELSLEFLRGNTGDPHEPAISIGDLHYSTLTDRIMRGEADLGHSIPKYVSPMTPEMLRNAVEKTTARPVKAYVNWKSLERGDRELLLKVLGELNVRIIKR